MRRLRRRIPQPYPHPRSGSHDPEHLGARLSPQLHGACPPSRARNIPEWLTEGADLQTQGFRAGGQAAARRCWNPSLQQAVLSATSGQRWAGRGLPVDGRPASVWLEPHPAHLCSALLRRMWPLLCVLWGATGATACADHSQKRHRHVQSGAPGRAGRYTHRRKRLFG